MLYTTLCHLSSRLQIGRSPRLFIWAVQIAIFALSGLFAFLIRFEFELTAPYLAQMAVAIPVWILVKTVVFRLLKLDRGWWRYVSMPDLVRVGFGNLAASALSTGVLLVAAPHGFPRSIYILDFLLCANATIGIRVLARILRGYVLRSKDEAQRKRVVIYGAGQAGDMLLREIRSNPRLAYDVRGFIDDNRQKVGMHLQFVTVLGTGADLPAIAARHAIDQVLIATPSATGLQMTGILESCHKAGLRCKTIPSLGELIENDHLAGQIRDVAVEDLLGRTPIELDESAIRARLEGMVVVVTGAAGSIGSELCRQVARFHPLAIIGFDAAETPLFHLQQEMRAAFPDVLFFAEIGNVQNAARLADVFDYYGPSILYHAAAYKHVPMMESCLFEAAENNILGTAAVAAAAAEYGLDDFVMISSDKAVRPTNVMGLTKRFAELLVGSMQSSSPQPAGTRFVSVRFGNVLGSNGSVIPTFKKQIAAGGPVTVTHPDMQRFFMTIPEAVQLVLQASTMGKGGEIFVLDMGQPVKIVDLARNLILLSGLRPDDDIKIEFTGVRPGEKLYEELSAYQENTLPTFHQKIKIFAGAAVSPEKIQDELRAVRRLCALRDAKGLVLRLKELVPDYNPSADILRTLFAAPPANENGNGKHRFLEAQSAKAASVG
jgi:FlaA1/EpsC-like NDP-sugar epimerase